MYITIHYAWEGFQIKLTFQMTHHVIITVPSVPGTFFFILQVNVSVCMTMSLRTQISHSLHGSAIQISGIEKMQNDG